jgi:hypothetical protein
MLEQLFFACGAMDDEPDAVQFSISATLAGQDA